MPALRTSPDTDLWLIHWGLGEVLPAPCAADVPGYRKPVPASSPKALPRSSTAHRPIDLARQPGRRCERRRIDRIGRREIEQFMAHMACTGRSPKTTLNALGVLRSIFEYARREGWVAAPPARSSTSHACRAAIPTSASSSPRRSRPCCVASPTTTSAASSGVKTMACTGPTSML